MYVYTCVCYMRTNAFIFCMMRIRSEDVCLCVRAAVYCMYIHIQRLCSEYGKEYGVAFDGMRVVISRITDVKLSVLTHTPHMHARTHALATAPHVTLHMHEGGQACLCPAGVRMMSWR